MIRSRPALTTSAHMQTPWQYLLQQAQKYAQAAQNDKLLLACQQIVDAHPENADALFDVASLLQSFGFISRSKELVNHVRALMPDDRRAIISLANLASEEGDHACSSQLYRELLQKFPDDAVIRRNALISLQYDPNASDGERLVQAQAWGKWAITRAGGKYARPEVYPLNSRQLRIGYVSADLCQHTVGLFVKDVIKAHASDKVIAYAYSAGLQNDWVTNEVRSRSQFRDVSRMDDVSLAKLIREDGIDILIDLSGHTAGSKLSVFVQRPAPVMVSWLGYFATTGLDYFDGILMDEWHVPQGAESSFTEPVIRLPGGRLCYQPVPWTSDIQPNPCIRNGFITFGCFNNTAKLNQAVYGLWVRILSNIPHSRLILKWRTFNDANLREQVQQAFAQRGIDPKRIELRGPSFHVDLLKEYADIDIALDPFPFTGGLTSCEALYMGVPVVTWPQSRAVSRQTYAYLSAIGLPELAARDADDYVHIVVELANDADRLVSLRKSMRERMQASTLMDVSGFAHQFEYNLIELYQAKYSQQEASKMAGPKVLLNVGAGHPDSGAKIPLAFQNADWREVRLDIDPVNQPEILGTMLDMSAVEDSSADAIYSSHNIEHLYPNEIPVALKEFLRVLKPEGYVVITCPDLQAAAKMIAEDKLMEVAYNSPAGGVTPFDIVYSHRMFTGRDKPYMAHHCGFTLSVLIGTLKSNGFTTVAGKRRPVAFDLWVVASKSEMAEDAIRELAGRVLPE